jgi:hypothetical protein
VFASFLLLELIVLPMENHIEAKEKGVKRTKGEGGGLKNEVQENCKTNRVLYYCSYQLDNFFLSSYRHQKGEYWRYVGVGKRVQEVSTEMFEDLDLRSSHSREGKEHGTSLLRCLHSQNQSVHY